MEIGDARREPITQQTTPGHSAGNVAKGQDEVNILTYSSHLLALNVITLHSFDVKVEGSRYRLATTTVRRCGGCEDWFGRAVVEP